jgi:hypothetical protein
MPPIRTIEDHAKEIRARSMSKAEELTRRARRMKIALFTVRMFNSMVGAGAILILILQKKVNIPPVWDEALSYLSAFTLLLATFLIGIIEDESPIVLQNYSRYLRHFAGDIETWLLDTRLPQAERLAKIEEAVKVARKNLDECES